MSKRRVKPTTNAKHDARRGNGSDAATLDETGPAHKLTATLKKLPPRRRVLLDAIANGKTIAEAGRIAGYKTRQVAHEAVKELREDGAIAELMDRLGLTPTVIIRNIKSKMNARQTKFAQKDGVFTDERTPETGDALQDRRRV